MRQDLNFGYLYYLNRFEQNQFSHSTICYHIEIEVTNFYATHSPGNKNFLQFVKNQFNDGDYCHILLFAKAVKSSLQKKDVKLLHTLWQYGLWRFQVGGTKLEIYLPKNQHTQRKLLNFEFWINGKLSKSAKI